VLAIVLIPFLILGLRHFLRTPPSELNLIRSRYARGEISREEYERLIKELGG
jgi:uncharacterized membrane protein